MTYFAEETAHIQFIILFSFVRCFFIFLSLDVFLFFFFAFIICNRKYLDFHFNHSLCVNIYQKENMYRK